MVYLMNINFSLIYIFILIFFFLNLFLILDRREIKINNVTNIKIEFIGLFTRNYKTLTPITKENKDIITSNYFNESLSFILSEQKNNNKEIVFEFLNYEPIEKSSFIFAAYPIKNGFKNSINFKKYLIAKSTTDYNTLLSFLKIDKYQDYNCEILTIDNINLAIRNGMNQKIKHVKSFALDEYFKNKNIVKVIYECY